MHSDQPGTLILIKFFVARPDGPIEYLETNSTRKQPFFQIS